MKSSTTYVATLQALANVLGVTRKTVGLWARLPGAPPKTERGYDMAAWQTFAATVSTKTGPGEITLAEARRIGQLIKNESDQLDLDAKKRLMIPVAELARELRQIELTRQTMLRQRLEVEMPIALAGKTVSEAREYAAALVDEICTLHNANIDRWVASVTPNNSQDAPEK